MSTSETIVRSVLAVLFVTSVGCGSNDDLGPDAGRFVDSTMDAQQVVDATSAVDMNEDVGTETDAAADASQEIEWYEDPGLIRPRAFYECGDGQALVDYGEPTVPYLPAPSDRFDDPLWYAELANIRAGLGPTNSITQFDPDDSVSYLSAMSVLNLERGQPLKLRFGFVYKVDGGAADQWITTLLIDYEPVEATFRFHDDAGETLAPPQSGTGFALPWPRYSGIAEVEIPGSYFEEPGYHEFLFRNAIRRPGAYPYQIAQRITVWVESNERPPHPCFERVEPVGPIPVELIDAANTAKFGFDRHMFLLPIDLVPYDQIEEEIVVSPEQIVDFDYYVIGNTNIRSALRWELPEVIVPAVNGIPIEEPSYVMLEVPPEEEPEDLMYKGSFSYEVPNEPGVYDVELIQVLEAFIPFMNWAGDFNQYPYPYPVRRGNIHQGTQIIRLRVPE